MRWLFGPVTLSAALPLRARELLVSYYRHYYGDLSQCVQAKAPFALSSAARLEAERLFDGHDREGDFLRLREQLEGMGVSVPVLYKQYCEVAEVGAVHFMDFGVDADFGYCLDGLVVVDVSRLKPEKRRRYLQEKPHTEAGEMTTIPESGVTPAQPQPLT
ncbi:hypothetical protein [Salinicola peritrichatus]|uniref:hypothetical protein n=1 Tax=Salinicola peritrichatus TaxID=1267424 RepID=UPI000DA1ECA0|nr:hypothetical protein [Salinicola peritrichatus]